MGSSGIDPARGPASFPGPAAQGWAPGTEQHSALLLSLVFASRIVGAKTPLWGSS